MFKKLLATIILSATSIAHAQTVIEINSEPGDYIGQGKNYLYDDSNAQITFNRNYDNGIKVSIRSLSNDDYFWWTLDLAAPGEQELDVGVYESAQRFPFQDADKPGLSFSGSGRGCNTLTGSFDVYDVSYDDDGNVESLNVTFEQHCEGGSPSLKGKLLFNTVTPVGVKGLGIQPKKVVCKNKTTGQVVKQKTVELIHDCKALGLDVNEGDTVVVKIKGIAE